MATKRRFEIAELFPQPKIVELGEGISELATDVRLATVNVWPVQRKALRSILTLAGVRVVANKKKYVVTATVREPEEEPDAFDLSKVPEELRRDYYELRIQGSEVFIEAPYQDGMVWAAQTLGMLFKMMIDGLAVPNLIIRDWPVIPLRGVKMECCLTTDRMDLNAWHQAIDIYSSFKLNMLGIGLYGCRPDDRLPEGGHPGEFLYPPVSEPADDADPHSETRYRFFNVKFDRWYDRTEPSAIFQEELLADIITYAHERGMAIFPIFDILGTNTLLPRMLPAISGRNAKGKPSGEGLCYSTPGAREALCKYFEKILELYFPDGVEYFHLGTLDSLTPAAPCQCAKCKAGPQPKLLAEYLAALIAWLTAHGVGKVIIGANLLFPKSGFATSVLGLLTKKAGIKEKLVIDFTATAGGRDCEAPKFADATKQKLAFCSGPVAAAGIQEEYRDCRKELDKALMQACDDKMTCVLANVQFDPIYMDHFALLGVRTWEEADPKLDTAESLRARWAELNWFAYADDVAAELKTLDELCASPVYKLCQPCSTLCAAGKGKAYPLDALDALAKDKKAEETLKELSARAGEIMATVKRRLERVNWTDFLKTALLSMLGEAQRIQINADCFLLMLSLRRQLAAKAPATAKIQTAIADGIQKLVGQLKVIEESVPDCLLWYMMQLLGCYKLLLERLQSQLKAKVPAAKLDWTLPENWEVPEDK